MAWDKLKSLFVVKPESGAVDREALEVVEGDLSAFQVPGDEVPPATPSAAPPPTPPVGGAIDFQGLYDQAGIPNTDEVEALEKFLGGLDMELPQPAKVAAAKAFLGAIGKSPSEVLEDAARKIQVVRVIDEAKRADAAKIIDEHQAGIDALQKQIEERRAAIYAVHGELEAVKGQCAVEEARLQGARTFFGVVGQLAPPAEAPQQPAGKKRR